MELVISLTLKTLVKFFAVRPPNSIAKTSIMEGGRTVLPL